MKRWLVTLGLILLLLISAGCNKDRPTDPGVKDIQSKPTTISEVVSPRTDIRSIPKAEEPLSSAGKTEDQAFAPVKENYFQLIVTQNFGTDKLDSRQVAIKADLNLLEYMQHELQVDTHYGGGFIGEINGLKSTNKSGNRYDWFFYVNGIGSPVGAAQIKPRAGDIIWWDYHSWGSGAGQPAVVGCYPQPLVNSRVKILANQRWEEMAWRCRERLVSNGAVQAEIADLTQQSNYLDKRSAPVVVIGTWEELEEILYLQKWNDAYRKNGSGIHFRDGELELLGADGTPRQIISAGGGVIIASGQGLGDHNPLWLIAGVDDEGVKLAVETFCSHPEEMAWKFGLAVQPGQIIALPVK